MQLWFNAMKDATRENGGGKLSIRDAHFLKKSEKESVRRVISMGASNKK